MQLSILIPSQGNSRGFNLIEKFPHQWTVKKKAMLLLRLSQVGLNHSSCLTGGLFQKPNPHLFPYPCSGRGSGG